MGCTLATPLARSVECGGFLLGGDRGELSWGLLGWHIPMICSDQEDCVPLPLQNAKEVFAAVSITGL